MRMKSRMYGIPPSLRECLLSTVSLSLSGVRNYPVLMALVKCIVIVNRTPRTPMPRTVILAPAADDDPIDWDDDDDHTPLDGMDHVQFCREMRGQPLPLDDRGRTTTVCVPISRTMTPSMYWLIQEILRSINSLMTACLIGLQRLPGGKVGCR